MAAPRLLIVSQYFAPEVTAARVRMETFAKGLAGRGWDVEVVAAVPNHPSGVIHAGFPRRGLRRWADGYEVHNVWVRTSPRKTKVNRLLLYGTYALSAVLDGLRGPRPDVVLATSPPLFTGGSAAAIARRFRVPWVFDVRDLWPEAAIAIGELSDGAAARAASWLERRLYASAERIVAVSAGYVDHIAANGGDRDRISVIPNGTTREWLEAGEAEVAPADVGLDPDRFNVTYAGNLGILQGLEAAVDAAGRIDDRFRLVLVGDGPARASLEERAAMLPPGRVEFRPLVQPKEARRLLRASNALLVSLGDAPALAKCVPSKLFDCCAVGRPVVLAAAGESARLANEAGAALTVPPGHPTELADAIERVASDESLARSLSDAARAFAAENLREAGVERLDELLRSLVPARDPA